MNNNNNVEVQGNVHPKFESVRTAFIENFTKRNELGGAVCVYQHGEKVVDLWGGIRDKKTNASWEEDTMVLVYSLTKGMSAMTLALAHSRGWLDYEMPVSYYWPEFSQNGKAEITVRHLLSHQAGLHAFHQTVDKETVGNLDRLAEVMALEKPEWKPGMRNAYHLMTLGFYEGELVRRVDPQRRSLGQFFFEEIAKPLNIDFHILIPDDIPNRRFARLDQGNLIHALIGLPFPMALALLNPWSHLFRAYAQNPGPGIVIDNEHIYTRNIEVPSGGGVGTARAIAKAYGVFAAGSRELTIQPATLAALKAPPIPPKNGSYDEVVKGDAAYSLGFLKSVPGFSFGHEGAFGAPGAGGSLGYADPEIELGYGYVTNRIGVGVDPDPRDIALRDAITMVTG